MGEILPDGSIQGYVGYCDVCKQSCEMNIQGNILKHNCSKRFNVIVKRGKYLSGRSYATGIGESYQWSKNIEDAIHYNCLSDNTTSNGIHLASIINGKLKTIQL